MSYLRRILKSSLVFSLCFALFLANTEVADACEINGEEEYLTVTDELEKNLPDKKENIKEIDSIEELDATDTITKTDSVFKSCRLIIYSVDEMEFRDIKGQDNIKSVQKLTENDMTAYIVEYASPNDSEDAYNFYTALGYEVEIDMMRDTPEGVENKTYDEKTNRTFDIESEEIAAANGDKDTQNADEINTEDKTIVVAVLDTGLNDGEDVFTDRIIEGKNFVDENSDKTNDINGHGTAMSRIILDSVNDKNIDNNIKVMPIKVLNDEGFGTTLCAYKGIKYAVEKNVNVINLSMSGIGHSKLLESAINDAKNHNIPVIVSAGNDNTEITEYTPANIEGAVTVSASDTSVNETGETVYTKAIYSNFGSDTNHIDFTTTGHYDYKRNINNKEVVTSVDGTSVSASYVTSYVALLKQLALSDKANDNDNPTFNDYYDSLKLSAIASDDTYVFGNGYLTKDNLKLISSSKADEVLPVEEITDDDINNENDIVLNTESGKYAACIQWVGGKYRVIGYNPKTQIGDTIGEYTSAKDAWGSAYFANVANNPGEIEIHIACDLNISLGASDTLINESGKSVWVRSQLGTVAGVTDNKVHKINVTGSGSKALINAKGVYIHNINIADNRTTNKTVSVLQSSNYMEVLGGSNITGKNATCVVYANGPGGSRFDNANIDGQASCKQGISIDSGGTNTIRGGSVYSAKECGIAVNPNKKVTINECNIRNNLKYGITITNCATATLQSGAVKENVLSGINVESGGKFNFSGGAIHNNQKQGIINRGTVNQSGSGRLIANSISGAENYSTYNMSGGTIGESSNANKEGINNNSGAAFNMRGGSISYNSSYGINNKGTVNHTAGDVNNNNGAKPIGSDVDYVGVYQNGTYNINGSAGVYGNSIYLLSGKYVNQQSKSFTGSASLTTASTDRPVGRELVLNSTSTANESKYSLAYGNSGTAGMKNEDGKTFDGHASTIRRGSRIYKSSGIKASSLYLSGKYNVYYNSDKPSDLIRSYVTPASDYATAFCWREEVTVNFGSYRYTDKTGSYEQTGYATSSSASAPSYTSDTTFNTASTVLTGNKTYYAVWKKKITDKYFVHYIYNNGYGDETTDTCLRDTTYTYRADPARYTSSNITFNTNGGDNITSVNGASYVSANRFTATKSFNGWSRATSSVKYKAPKTFTNLGAKDTTVDLYGNWTINTFILPNCEKDDYELVGWNVSGTSSILPVGSTYTPDNDNPVNFIAIWKPIERNIVYNPNGAVDKNGNTVGSIIEEKNTPVTEPVTLLGGTDIGGKVLSEDTTFTRGYVEPDLSPNMLSAGVSESVQYRAKKGDIVNNLGDNNMLAKFMGWSKTPTGGTAFNGTVNLTDSALWGDSAKKTKVFRFYAMWDRFPTINTSTITLSDVNNISKSDLLKNVTAGDSEDGSITNKINLINYNEIKTAFKNGALEFTAIYEVTDSAGNTTRAFAKVRKGENDTYDGKALNVITKQVRSINRHAYDTHNSSLGGCLDNSPWYNDPTYVATMTKGFDNMDNNTPIKTVTLTKAEREEIINHIHSVGVSKMHDKNVLQYYVDSYMDAEHTSRKFEYYDSAVGPYTILAETMKEREMQELERLKALRNDMDLGRTYR